MQQWLQIGKATGNPESGALARIAERVEPRVRGQRCYPGHPPGTRSAP
jgi:hypothetical protein